MSSHPRLQNYLRTYRRRAGFSQDEIAYLLGAKSGTKTSRYERFRRTPSLETALAYEALFGVPVRELFAGVSARAERMTRRRARLLKKRLEATGRCSDRLLGLLGDVAPGEEAKLVA
jgi:transcriptional regulator with XRE-family HTH domain